MNSLKLLALGIFGGLLISACQPSSLPPGPQQTASPSPVQKLVAPPPSAVPELVISKEVSVGLANFNKNLYEAVAGKKPGNLAVSPLGSYLLLGLMQEGAEGRTKEEIAAATGLKGEVLGELTKLAGGLDETESLALAQKIYLDQSVKLVESYSVKIKPLLTDPVQVLPFSTDPKRATQVINDWVAERTAGLIKDFLPTLGRDTVSVLVSALHFKGSWRSKFEKEHTRPGTFTTSSGETLQTPMMTRPGVASFRLRGATGVTLPYQEGFEMVFLLPDQGIEPDKALSSFYLEPSESAEEVTLRLPRFEFEVPTFELTEAWREIGLAQVVKNPDLTRMLILDSPERLELNIYHKTYVKVDEEGTEAAAATAVVVSRRGSAVKPPPKVLTFERPFAFLLRHSGSGAVLMMGRVDRPEKLAAEPSGN